jgi:hypothetical protein
MRLLVTSNRRTNNSHRPENSRPRPYLNPVGRSVRLGGPPNFRQAASDARRHRRILAPRWLSSFIPRPYPLWLFRWGLPRSHNGLVTPNRFLLLALSNPRSQAEISSLGAEHYLSTVCPCQQQLGTYLSLSIAQNTVSSPRPRTFGGDSGLCSPALQCVLRGQVVCYLSLQSNSFEVDGDSHPRPSAEPQYCDLVLGSLNQRHEICDV